MPFHPKALQCCYSGSRRVFHHPDSCFKYNLKRGLLNSFERVTHCLTAESVSSITGTGRPVQGLLERDVMIETLTQNANFQEHSESDSGLHSIRTWVQKKKEVMRKQGSDAEVGWVWSNGGAVREAVRKGFYLLEGKTNRSTGLLQKAQTKHRLVCCRTVSNSLESRNPEPELFP